jgi:hypothetical protein
MPAKPLKNKQFMFVVMRHDVHASVDNSRDVVCCVSNDQEKAYELEGEYSQAFIDKGVSPDESYFYTTCTTFYT